MSPKYFFFLGLLKIIKYAYFNELKCASNIFNYGEKNLRKTLILEKLFFFWFERPPQNRILGASLSNCDIEDLLYFHVDFCISTANKAMQTFTKLKLLKQKTTNLK